MVSEPDMHTQERVTHTSTPFSVNTIEVMVLNISLQPASFVESISGVTLLKKNCLKKKIVLALHTVNIKVFHLLQIYSCYACETPDGNISYNRCKQSTKWRH